MNSDPTEQCPLSSCKYSEFSKLLIINIIKPKNIHPDDRTVKNLLNIGEKNWDKNIETQLIDTYMF